MTEQINQNSVAGSHEMRGEVIFKQQDSTRNLIQFSINQPLPTHFSTISVVDSVSDSE